MEKEKNTDAFLNEINQDVIKEALEEEKKKREEQEKEFFATMGKIEMSPEQLEEFLLTGEFPVKREFLKGKVIAEYRFISSKELLEMKEKNYPTEVMEGKREPNKAEVDQINYVWSKRVYAFKDENGKDLDFDKIYKSYFFENSIDRFYGLVEKIYRTLLKDGVFNPTGEEFVRDAVKKPSEDQASM